MASYYLKLPSIITSLNSLTGALTLAAGSNISIAPASNTLTIATVGATGSFTTVDLKTVTVTNGIITAISS